jgi:hypothetical protein
VLVLECMVCTANPCLHESISSDPPGVNHPAATARPPTLCQVGLLLPPLPLVLGLGHIKLTEVDITLAFVPDGVQPFKEDHKYSIHPLVFTPLFISPDLWYD